MSLQHTLLAIQAEFQKLADIPGNDLRADYVKVPRQPGKWTLRDGDSFTREKF